MYLTTRLVRLVPIACMLAACGSGGSNRSDGAVGDGGIDAGASCLNVEPVVSIQGPVDGHHSHDPIVIRTTGVAPEFTLELDGETQPGTWLQDETKIKFWTFEPANAIVPATTYRWRVRTDEEHCVEENFTTSDVGLPVTSPEALIGQTFEVVVNPFAFFEQPLLSDLSFLLVQYEHPPFLLRIDSLDGASVQVTLAPTIPPPGSLGPKQDACKLPTTHLGSWDGARLQLEGESLLLPIGAAGTPGGGYSVSTPTTLELTDWSLDLVIHPEGTKATLQALLFNADTRELTDFQRTTAEGGIAPDGTPTNFCTVAAGSVECEACQDGVESCLRGVFEGTTLPGTVATDMVDVEEGQQENHLCTDSCGNEVDDDGDEEIDVDAECDPKAWP